MPGDASQRLDIERFVSRHLAPRSPIHDHAWVLDPKRGSGLGGPAEGFDRCIYGRDVRVHSRNVSHSVKLFQAVIREYFSGAFYAIFTA